MTLMVSADSSEVVLPRPSDFCPLASTIVTSCEGTETSVPVLNEDPEPPGYE